MNWKVWLKGLAAAAIGGAANGVTAIIVAPESFNLQAGWKNLASMCAVSAVVSIALYLKQSPVPGDEKLPVVDLRKVGPLLLIVALLPTLVGCGAARSKPRHIAVEAESALLAAMQATVATEKALFDSGRIPLGVYEPATATTPEVCSGHKCYNAKFNVVATYGLHINRVLAAWPADKPTPTELANIVQATSTVVRDIVSTMPQSDAKDQILAKLAILQALLNTFLVPEGA